MTKARVEAIALLEWQGVLRIRHGADTEALRVAQRRNNLWTLEDALWGLPQAVDLLWLAGVDHEDVLAAIQWVADDLITEGLAKLEE